MVRYSAGVTSRAEGEKRAYEDEGDEEVLAPSFKVDTKQLVHTASGQAEPVAVTTVMRFKDGDFIENFKACLNAEGGMWVTVLAEGEAGGEAVAKYASGLEKTVARGWLDLTPFQTPGVKSIDGAEIALEFPTAPAPEAPADGEEAPPAAYAKVSLSLREPLVPVEAAPEALCGLEVYEKMQTLQPDFVVNKANNADEVEAAFGQALEQCVAAVVARYDAAYADYKMMVNMHPGGQRNYDAEKIGEAVPESFELPEPDAVALNGELEKILYRAATAYATEHVVKSARGEHWEPDASVPGDSGVNESSISRFIAGVYAEMSSRVLPAAVRSLATKYNLVETDLSVRSSAEIKAQASVVTRAKRLLIESEMCGNTKRAAGFHQTLCAANETREDAKTWAEYAKFLIRCGGRATAAEQAVVEGLAVQHKLKGAANYEEYLAAGDWAGDYMELLLLQVGLLIERSEYRQAERMLRTMLDARRSEPMLNVLLGITLFLQYNNVALGAAYLSLATKQKEWFRGLKNEGEVLQKMELFLSAGDAMSVAHGHSSSSSESRGNESVGASGPNSDFVDTDLLEPPTTSLGREAKSMLLICTERLLDYGLSKLVFTILDTPELLKSVGCNAIT